MVAPLPNPYAPTGWGSVFNPYLIKAGGLGEPSPVVTGKASVEANGAPAIDAGVLKVDMPEASVIPAPVSTPSKPGMLGTMKSRPAPSNAIAESLIADSAGGVHSPWEALGKLSEFGVGHLANRAYGKKQAEYEQAPFDELRHNLALGMSVDEAMKQSSYPEMWKLWLAREMNPALGQKSLTGDWENYIHSLAPGEAPTGPGFAEYQTKLREAGRITIDQKGPSSFDTNYYGEAAKEAAGYNKAASKSAIEVQKANMLGQMLDRVTTGPLAGTEITVGGFMQSIGLDPSLVGIDPKQPANLQIVEGLTNSMIMGKIGGEGGFPANNFSEADRKFITSTIPQATDLPGAIRVKLEVSKRLDQLNVQRGQAWQQALSDGRKAGMSNDQIYDQFQTDWTQHVSSQNLFGDLITKYDEVVAAGPEDPNKPPPRPITPLNEEQKAGMLNEALKLFADPKTTPEQKQAIIDKMESSGIDTSRFK